MRNRYLFAFLIFSFLFISNNVAFAEDQQVYVEANVLEVNDNTLRQLDTNFDDLLRRERAPGSDGRGVDAVGSAISGNDANGLNFAPNPNANGNFEIPQVNTRSVNTTVQLQDGDTVALGGLIESEENQRVMKTPVLGDIPLVGRLFKNTDDAQKNKELVVTLTPELVDPASQEP